MIVIKLGGSLYNTPELKHWLSTLADYSKKQPLVIVPGGGPFADQVRNAQKKHHFSDEIAHHMAIIAMKQFGLMIKALEPRLEPQSEYHDFAIWLPDDSLLDQSLLSKNWDISSDSIALWFAHQSNAEQLFLVKRSTHVYESIEKLCSLEIIDKGFPQLFSHIPVTTKIINYQHCAKLAERVKDKARLSLS